MNTKLERIIIRKKQYELLGEDLDEVVRLVEKRAIGERDLE